MLLGKKGERYPLQKVYRVLRALQAGIATDDQPCMGYKSDKENRWQAAADLKNYWSLTI
jgi:hypothetical protein